MPIFFVKSAYEGVYFGWIHPDYASDTSQGYTFFAGISGKASGRILKGSLSLNYVPNSIWYQRITTYAEGTLSTLEYHTPELKKEYERNGFATALLLTRLIFALTKKCTILKTNQTSEGRTGVMYEKLGFQNSKHGGDKNYSYSLHFSRDLADLASNSQELRLFVSKMDDSGVTVEEILDACIHLVKLIKLCKPLQDCDLAEHIPKFVEEFKQRYLE